MNLFTHLQAVAPELHGAMTAKLAILLALLGGVGAGGPESEAGGSGGERGNARGEIHVLLVGDPATGGNAFWPASLVSGYVYCSWRLKLVD